MKKILRTGVFETNSSSTHSITICTKEEYDLYEKGEMYLNHNNNLVTKEQLFESWQNGQKNICRWENKPFVPLTEEELESLFKKKKEEDEDYESCLEPYLERRTLPNGQEVVVFGEFGYNG